MPKIYNQDGAQFYDALTGRIICEYTELFDFECDYVGAVLAWLVFTVEHPDYMMAETFD